MRISDWSSDVCSSDLEGVHTSRRVDESGTWRMFIWLGGTSSSPMITAHPGTNPSPCTEIGNPPPSGMSAGFTSMTAGSADPRDMSVRAGGAYDGGSLAFRAAATVEFWGDWPNESDGIQKGL